MAPGASRCDNCGAAPPGARRRFRPTLTGLELPDLAEVRAAAVGLEPGAVVHEQFVLVAPLGEAPGGWLFAARDRGSDVALTLRFVEPAYLPDEAARAHALAELERARRLSHDNIVRTYAVGRHGERLFVAAERLEGLTLRKVIDLRREKKQRFTLGEIRPIFEQIRDALMHAHRHLPHGGLDAASVHILPAALKVDGFGMAAALPGGAFVRARRAAGREAGLAPEVRRGEPPTPQSDVFGLGALVYEMLTGRPLADDAPPPTVALGMATDGEHPLDALIARATAPDPAARFPDLVAFAEAFAEALAAHVDGPPLAADEEELTRRVKAPPGRRRSEPEPPGDAPPAKGEAPPSGGSERPGAGAPTGPPSPPAGPAAPIANRASAQAQPPPLVGLGAPIAGRPSAQGPPPAFGAPLTGRASVPAGAPLMGRGSAQIAPGGPSARGALVGTGPSVVIDPAFVQLDTMPPPVDYRASRDDRTPTQSVRVPPTRRPWWIRSNLGFGLALALIVVGVSAAALYAIRRDEPAPVVGPATGALPAVAPRARRELPPAVVVQPVADSPDSAPAAPTPSPPKPPAAPEAPPPKPVERRPEAPARAIPEPPPPPAEPREPPPVEPPPAEPPPIAAATPPEPPPEPAPPAAPAELKCPAGMTLITGRGFPADGKKRGAIVTEAGIAAARAGEAYCIDTYEYPGRGQPPRTGVNFEAARGLCLARGRRLCTDDEWRRACAGRKGGAWPYGGAFDPAKCNTEDAEGEERAVAASGSFKRCKSLRGVYDMSGNVAEWTADQTVRGGDFASADEDASCGAGGKRAPSSSRASIGFRCCSDFTE